MSGPAHASPRARCVRTALAALLFLALAPCTPGGVSSRNEEPRPLPPVRSPLHVCLSSNGLAAYVVNHTGASVSIVDVRARKVVGEIPVGPRPGHATLSLDGRTLFVSNVEGQAVQVVDLAKRRVVRELPAGYEPYGLALAPDGSALYVAHALSETVTATDPRTGKNLWETPAGRSPRYLAVTPDGARLVVANGLSRNVSILDAATGRVEETRDLGRASILRQVLCSRDGRWAFVVHVVSHDEQVTSQIERGWIHSNGFSILDLSQPGHRVTLLLDRLTDGAANPWGAALSRDGRRLYVTLSGVHELALVDVEAALRLAAETGSSPAAVKALEENVEILDQRGIARRMPTGGEGPRGLAISEAAGEVLVANYFSDSLSVLDAATGGLRAAIPLGPRREPDDWRRGEMLFNDARLCYQRWFSCASCHQEDATVDGLNWDLLNDGAGNPKNAKSLHDICDTAPAMWTAAREDMNACVAAGQRFSGFLPNPENHRALLAYLGAPRRAPNPYRTRNPEALRRGSDAFHKGGCDSCHVPPKYTDLDQHDLDTANPNDLHTSFDTPSLRECYRTAPYLHDGSARTLREIFTLRNPKGWHGAWQGLTEGEREDLLEFLRSL